MHRKKLNIHHIIFSSGMGGLEQAYINYTRALLIRGHKVKSIIADKASYKDRVGDMGVDIVSINIHGFYDVFASMKLRKLFHQDRPDLIIAHNGRAIVTASRAMWGLDIPLIGVSHSNNVKHSSKADRLLFTNEIMQQHFVDTGYPLENCAVIGNMIDIPAQIDTSGWRKHSPPTVGFLGRLSPEKGAEQLIEALALLKDRDVEVNLKIGGDGLGRQKLLSLANHFRLSGQVEFCDWIPEENKSDFFSEIDVLCVPSYRESFGLVVLEAWQHNVPVIASNTDGSGSIIAHNVNGLLYGRGNYAELAENIERILFEDDNLADKLIDGGRSSVAEYSIEKTSTKLEKSLFALMQ